MTMLNITELNVVLKYYAFNLPQRIEELSQLVYPQNPLQDQEHA